MHSNKSIYFSDSPMVKDPTHYLVDLSYDKDPLFGAFFGGGFAGPSLGGTIVYGSISLYLGEPKRPESQ